MNTYYHAAPRAFHASIQTNGLDFSLEGPLNLDEGGLEANYLFASRANAEVYAHMRTQHERDEYGMDAHEYEVWEVNTTGVTLFVDRSTDDVSDDIRDEYPDELVSVYTTEKLAAWRLQNSSGQ